MAGGVVGWWGGGSSGRSCSCGGDRGRSGGSGRDRGRGRSGGGVAQTVAQWPQAGKYEGYLLVVKLSLISHPRVMRSVSSGEREQGLGWAV